ncbi:hypothetical protein OQJ46_06635 [Microbulbifer thermotolerans]|uniref:hypothetical protein n=1 Tax=Microbulbifer thermotolerans TaxID=252514 RepID=UPI00224A9E77|nr:hypothetical protein [Microbulbifer thermotolerans]MCX2782659.1 hypothetical protein [Microbulbifer thermotolerans]
MHLAELTSVINSPTANTVPRWMRGCFQRRSISFANGQTDTDTRVFWLQSNLLTIDLRLPVTAQQEKEGDDIQKKADYEGWYAHADWDGKQLQWRSGATYQLHNRWPEPAILQRIGNCMMEFAPSGIYVEDWRLLSDQPGPLIGLELISETDLSSGTTSPRKGALIICGRHAGLVIDRPHPISDSGGLLKQRLTNLQIDESERSNLLDFETSVALGSLSEGFTVQHSLHKYRLQQPLLSLTGFELDAKSGYLRQRTEDNGKAVERLFRIDCCEMEFPFTPCTPSSEDSLEWFQREAPTLTRYTRVLYQN